MKRFTKVCLVLGILLLVSGAALGGVSYGLGVEKDIRSAMNPPAPEMEEITIPGAELGRLEIGLISDDVTVEASKDGDAHIRYPVSEEYRYALQTEEGKIRGQDQCVFQAEALERQRAFRFQVSLFWQGGPDVTVALPANYTGELQIRTVSGDVAVRGITAGKSAVDTDSGDLLLSDAVISGKIDISSTSGSRANREKTCSGKSAKMTARSAQKPALMTRMQPVVWETRSSFLAAKLCAMMELPAVIMAAQQIVATKVSLLPTAVAAEATTP